MMYRDRCIATVDIVLDMDTNVIWGIWHACLINKAGLKNNHATRNTASYLEELTK